MTAVANAATSPGADTPGDTDESGNALRTRVSVALRWSFANTVATRAGQLALSVFLAHLLAPREFGVYAVALVVINITMSISELGASVALVRYEGEPRDIAPTVTTIAYASSGVLALMCFVGAPAFAAAMGTPEATGVVRLLSFALLTSGLSAVPGAMLQRDFRQDHKMLADTSSFVLSTAVVVILALAGFGPWALAWSRIVANTSSAAIMTALASQRFWPGFNRGRAREILKFSIPLSASSLLVFVVLNVDYIVIGAVLGPVQLGLYLIAFNLSSWPVSAFSSSIRSVSVAGFANLQGDRARLRTAFSSSLHLLMTLSIPACVLLAVFATPLVRFVYGDRWLPSALPLVVLSLVGVLRIAMELAYDCLAAVGHTTSILFVHLLWLAALIPALLIGAQHGGIVGVAWGHLIALGVIVVPAYIWALSAALLPLRSYAPGLVRPAVGGLVMVGVGVGIATLLSSDFAVLAVGGVVSVLGYAAIVVPGRGGLLRSGRAALGRTP
jgi:O-antigen/teichoic acid export membrane protein